VAILPFINLSGDPENEFFTDGITEDVIAHLAKIRSIKVISRASVMAFKHRNRSLREIGEKLGAATLLDGSVRRSGNRVRIVAVLINGESDEHIWADTYDRDLTDIFAIQTDVALKIADALRAELSSQERARIGRQPTADFEAYDLYLRGRSSLYRFTAESFRQSLKEFEGAIARDPDFALAHASIAQLYAESGVQGSMGRSPEISSGRGGSWASCTTWLLTRSCRPITSRTSTPASVKLTRQSTGSNRRSRCARARSTASKGRFCSPACTRTLDSRHCCAR